jgi:DNA invertase Pin-like site-specific DNA recombinase
MKTAYSYIRFSTPEQAKGNSLERQLENTLKYTKKHDLQLDATLNLRDLGISGYKGDNVKKGALGRFLEAIQMGLIQKGSLLIVESLDRLSRAAVIDQLTIFTQIIKAGISIVTLCDEKIYSSESIRQNNMDLFGSLLIMCRAHEESDIKAMRVAAAWEKKRSSGKPLTGKCPAWLKLDKESNHFEIIESRGDLVTRIFKLAESGIGKGSIAKRFNNEGLPAWGSGNGWQPSYIQKILENRSVIGEFQPHKMFEGKRVPVGEPIKSYFPAVISEPVFFKVTSQRKKNANFCGKVGKGLSNIFTGLAKCGYTGSPMVYVNKGKWQYLVSDAARRGTGGNYISWTYKDFETSFLTFMNELDFKSLTVTGRDDKQANLYAVIARQNEELEKTQKQLNRLVDIIKSSDTPPDSILEEITKHEADKRRISGQIGESESQLENLNNISESFKTNGYELKHLIQSKYNDVDFRFKLRNAIREKVSKIEVFAGGPPTHLAQFFETSFVKDECTDRRTRFFIVYFKNGAFRAVMCGCQNSGKLCIMNFIPDGQPTPTDVDTTFFPISFDTREAKGLLFIQSANVAA